MDEVMEVIKQWAFDHWEQFKDVEGLKSWTRSDHRDNSIMGTDLRSRLADKLQSKSPLPQDRQDRDRQHCQ